MRVRAEHLPQRGVHDVRARVGLRSASSVIGVDTGLAHLATALGTPTIALYVATDPALTGVYGPGFARNLGGKNNPPAPEIVLATAEQELRRWHA